MITIFFLLITAFMGFAQQSRFLNVLHDFQGTKIVRHVVFDGQAPRFEELRARRDEFSNYEQFVGLLFRQDPQLASNYVLMSRSESQQLGSPENPRVILFHGGVFFGLSDHPDQKDRRIEILETDPRTYEIRLHEIVFRNEGVEFHENPSSCIACHGQPAKTLWNPYDFWPNVFGAAVGRIHTQGEADAFQKLARAPTRSPALRHLNLPQKLDFGSENVTFLTQSLQQVNLGRWISQNLGPDSKLGGFALPLMGITSNCAVSIAGSLANFGQTQLEAFFRPDEPLQNVASLTQIGTDVTASRRRFKNFLDQVSAEIFPKSPITGPIDHSRLESEVTILAQMHWVLNAAGIDTRSLTQSLFGNDFLISSPSNFSVDFLTSLYEIRPDLFKDVKFSTQDLGTGTTHWVLADCEAIRSQSRGAKRDWQAAPWRSFEAPSAAQPVLSRCAKCHVEGLTAIPMLAPSIPFENPLRLARAGLKQKILNRVSARDSKQMPPGAPLSETEILALREFLENIEAN